MRTLRQLYPTMLCALFVATAAGHLQAQERFLPGQVSVVDDHLVRDGRPWIPNGFFQIAFAVPPGAFELSGQNPNFQNAYDNYSPAEYFEMKLAGADSVRLNVAQDGADPENTKYYDPQWLRQVIRAIQSAREAGLSVIVSIQDETQTGSKKKAVLPNDATRRVWCQLAPIFRKDRGVLFELYNEPGVASATEPTEQEWNAWAQAMNQTIMTVRTLGARNVVVADGLALAQQLTGAPALNDPLHQVAYASHPYPHNAAGQENTIWDEKFGNVSQTHPVIITEWGTGYYCDPNTPQSVVNFLGYLQEHRVGLEAAAWDWGVYDFASAVQGFPDPHFSSLLTLTSPEACSAANGFTAGTADGPSTAFGPGKVIETWYHTHVPPAQPE